MHVTIISTGEELIAGRTLDTNASFLASRLTTHGFRVKRCLVIGDDPGALEKELKRVAEDSDFILVSGGLGPTADDRTRDAVARAAAADLVQDEESLRHVRHVIKSHGHKVTKAHERQALFPAGAEILPNNRGTARGFACSIGKAKAIVMPGVPDEMTHMFEDSVLPSLLKSCAEKVLVRRVNIFGLPESQVDALIGDLMEVERNPSVGITVDGGVVSICLSARSNNAAESARMIEQDTQTVRDRFGDAIFGYDETTLAAALGSLLEREGLSIALAESCTGGLIGGMLTEVPGISRFFLVDIVAYSNEAKVSKLGVPEDVIASFGAVSTQVAESMARGVCETSGAALGISTTGIAGPSGGTPEKPVGLVHVGVCLEGHTTVHTLQLRGDRARIRDRVAKSALNLARLALLERTRNN